MKRFLISMILLGAGLASFGAAPAPYPITVNSRASKAPPLEVYRGNRTVIRASFVDGTNASVIASNETPFMAWWTNDTASTVVTASYETVAGTTGVVDFTFSQSDLNYAQGRYGYEIGVKDTNSAPSVYRQGIFVIEGSPVGQGVASTTFSTNINWALYSFTGTTPDGPVRPDGSTITATTNADGSITIAADATGAPLTGDLDLNSNGIDNVQTIQFDLNFSDGSAEGRLQWNSDDGTLEYGLPGGSVNLQVGQESLVRVKNVSGATITNGQALAVVTASGNRPGVVLADSDASSPTNIFDGLATEDIANNALGYMTTHGLVRGLDTSAFSEGAELYLSTTAGALTTSRPAAPSEASVVGTVVVSNNSSGIILVSHHTSKTWTELDSRYYNVSGDTLSGTLNGGGQKATNFTGLIELNMDGNEGIRVTGTGSLLHQDDELWWKNSGGTDKGYLGYSAAGFGAIAADSLYWINDNYNFIELKADGDIELDGSDVRIIGGNLDMQANSITNVADPTADQDAATKAYVDSATGTPYAITYASTVTLQVANGWLQSYAPTNDTTIELEAAGTNVISQINLSLWAGENTITFGTSLVSYAETITPDTNDCTTILYYSELWKTNWSGAEL